MHITLEAIMSAHGGGGSHKSSGGGGGGGGGSGGSPGIGLVAFFIVVPILLFSSWRGKGKPSLPPTPVEESVQTEGDEGSEVATPEQSTPEPSQIPEESLAQGDLRYGRNSSVGSRPPQITLENGAEVKKFYRQELERLRQRR
ncbi:MAG: hypothetical protein PHV93_02555 [Candidatus Pacebacteria bacterium]|nr:hypothetical protein [Candidatus Paceibacterota bacterium]